MVMGPPSGERASESLLQDAFLGTRLCESNLLEVYYEHAAQLYGGICSRGGPGAVAVCWIDTTFRGLRASALVCRCPEIHQSGGSSERWGRGGLASLLWILNCVHCCVKKAFPDVSRLSWDLESLTSPSHWGGTWGLRGGERWPGFVPTSEPRLFVSPKGGRWHLGKKEPC